RQVSLRQAQANLAANQANLVKARQDYERLKPLVEQDAASKQDLDAAIANLRAAEAAVNANQANVEQTGLSTQTQIQAQEGKVQALRGALRNANLNLDYGTIRAPISGLIGDSLIPVGGLVTPGAAQPLATIVPLDPIWVRFNISEATYLDYKRRAGGKGANLSRRLILADNPLYPHPGRIENTNNQVDVRTGTLEVEARFPNPQHTLLPGQFGRARVQVETRKQALLIPQRAIQQLQSLQTVYTVSADNKVESRVVTTGPHAGDQVIVEQGLKPADR